MKILILDDERKSREVLSALLNLYCEGISEIETCADIQSALQHIHKSKPDIVFLDISLREGDSFDLLKQIPDFKFEIIFITAYDEVSVRALNYSEIPCLMKPIEIDKLTDAVYKVSQQVGSGTSQKNYQIASYLLQQEIKVLPIKNGKEWSLIPIEHLIRIYPKGNVSVVESKSGNIESVTQVTEFESLLQRQGFMLNKAKVLERVGD